MAKKVIEQSDDQVTEIRAEKTVLDAYFHQGVTIVTGTNQRETIQHASFAKVDEDGKVTTNKAVKYAARYTPQGIWIKAKGRHEETLIPWANIRYATMV